MVQRSEPQPATHFVDACDVVGRDKFRVGRCGRLQRLRPRLQVTGPDLAGDDARKVFEGFQDSVRLERKVMTM